MHAALPALLFSFEFAGSLVMILSAFWLGKQAAVGQRDASRRGRMLLLAKMLALGTAIVFAFAVTLLAIFAFMFSY